MFSKYCEYRVSLCDALRPLIPFSVTIWSRLCMEINAGKKGPLISYKVISHSAPADSHLPSSPTITVPGEEKKKKSAARFPPLLAGGALWPHCLPSFASTSLFTPVACSWSLLMSCKLFFKAAKPQLQKWSQWEQRHALTPVHIGTAPTSFQLHHFLWRGKIGGAHIQGLKGWIKTRPISII